uniref:NodB homology domain-containing protein n=1 Tax=Biomphalaria glabrata TaxID=6526 RepID=A0A2C9KVY9_BIOGL
MFVAITFDDSINHDRYNSQFRPFFVDNDYNLYNPNGCGLKTTLFVSLDAGDISLVKTLWDAGNEIAGHTLAHSLPVGSSEDDYIPTIEAIDGMRKKLLEEIGDSQLVFTPPLF